MTKVYRRLKFWLGHYIQDRIEYPEVTALRRRLRLEAQAHADKLAWEARKRCQMKNC